MTRSWIFRLALDSAIVFCTLVVEFWPTHRRPPTVRGAEGERT